MPESELIDEVANMIDNALRGSEPKRQIWDNADYLCAVLAILTGDSDRARDALMMYRAKYSSKYPSRFG